LPSKEAKLQLVVGKGDVEDRTLRNPCSRDGHEHGEYAQAYEQQGNNAPKSPAEIMDNDAG
jgi:hypothetical protein